MHHRQSLQARKEERAEKREMQERERQSGSGSHTRTLVHYCRAHCRLRSQYTTSTSTSISICDMYVCLYDPLVTLSMSSLSLVPVYPAALSTTHLH